MTQCLLPFLINPKSKIQLYLQMYLVENLGSLWFMRALQGSNHISHTQHNKKSAINLLGIEGDTGKQSLLLLLQLLISLQK